jgi:ubiquitin carboxyl-terminal hydrolase 40
MTPEFRRSLFRLSPEELGYINGIGSTATAAGKVKLRVIPVQLQRLFARLLLLEASAVGTDELTASFGWTNHEERDQHDVQELNRILFRSVTLTLLLMVCLRILLQHNVYST